MHLVMEVKMMTLFIIREICFLLFWLTGFPGSGKTAIANKIKSEIIKLYGPTILISGDNLRKIFYGEEAEELRRIQGKDPLCKGCAMRCMGSASGLLTLKGQFATLDTYGRSIW